MPHQRREHMAKSRAILTETEREQIAGEHGDKRRYEATSRARARIRDELAVDIEILREHNPDLLDEIREVVCADAVDPNAGDRDTSETGENRPEIDPILDEGNGSDAVDNDDEPVEAVEDATDPIAAVVDRVADGWDDTADRLADRKAAARAVLQYARDHGSVSKQEAKDEIEPEYSVDGQNPRTWYRKNIRPVLKEAAQYDQSERAHTLDNALVARAGGDLDNEDDDNDDEFRF